MLSDDRKKSLKPRFSNKELLRILAVLLIVMHHFSVHGFDKNALNYGEIWSLLICSQLEVSSVLTCLFWLVDIFWPTVLLWWKKFFKIGGQIWIYSVSIVFVFVVIISLGRELDYNAFIGCHFSGKPTGTWN